MSLYFVRDSEPKTRFHDGSTIGSMLRQQGLCVLATEVVAKIDVSDEEIEKIRRALAAKGLTLLVPEKSSD